VEAALEPRSARASWPAGRPIARRTQPRRARREFSIHRCAKGRLTGTLVPGEGSWIRNAGDGEGPEGATFVTSAADGRKRQTRASPLGRRGALGFVLRNAWRSETAQRSPRARGVRRLEDSRARRPLAALSAEEASADDFRGVFGVRYTGFHISVAEADGRSTGGLVQAMTRLHGIQMSDSDQTLGFAAHFPMRWLNAAKEHPTGAAVGPATPAERLRARRGLMREHLGRAPSTSEPTSRGAC